MTWRQFRAWAWEALNYRIDLYPPHGNGPAWRAIWGDDGPFRTSRTDTGSGNQAVYGPIQQRRLVLWIRGRHLVDKLQLASWLNFGQSYDDGWLVNDGRGLRWVADPETEALELTRRGFIAVKCGLPV
jgi:hypothetical protein